MPSNNLNQKVGQNSTGKALLIGSSSRRNSRKAPGTRWGTLQDWREVSKAAENTSVRHGQAIRDGRE